MIGESVKIAVVGLGTVGTGLIRTLQENRATIRARCGVDLELRSVCVRSLRKKRAVTLRPGILTTDRRAVLDDPQVDIVVELVGGTGAAAEIVMGALQRGKHVVTANKALLAERWTELFSLARRRGCGIQFEASVMAGVPVVRVLNEGLAGNAVESMLGVLNGTTNYILTRIAADGMDYRAALRQARARGICEADPRLDVQGVDAAYKLSILGSIALGQWLPPGSVHREGITHLEAKDIRYARELFSYHPKLLAIFKHKNRRVEARVHPAFVPVSHPLAAVVDEYNAVYITARPVGSIMLYGRGAGALSAASAVASDIIHLARAVSSGVSGRILTPVAFSGKAATPVPIEEVRSKYYMRFTVADRPGVLSRISGAFGQEGVSIESVYQPRVRGEGADIVMVTHEAQDGAVKRACGRLVRMRDIVRRSPAVVRIEEGEYAGRDH
jgi:homoserine dehydrogenase